MGFIGGRLGHWMLRNRAPRGGAGAESSEATSAATQLVALFGDDFFERIRGRTVLDFGCGTGQEAVEMAVQGAARVIGLELQQRWIEQASERARESGVSDRCTFATHTEERVDIIVSKDAFEHFEDPGAALRQMSALLEPGGCVLAAFGPTWLHPYGGHLFSVFPWAHLLFTEAALIRWRSSYRSDGATRFSEVAGGLNQMTIRRFERLIRESPLRAESLEPVPIKKLRPLTLPVLREFGSSIVRCRLVHR